MVFRVQILVDWSRAFVDPDGSLYCQTTEEQKDTAVRLLKKGDTDLFVYAVDVHPNGSSEFLANGGRYGAHNLVAFDTPDYYDQATLEGLGIKEGQTASCRLTQKLEDVVGRLPSGLVVPRHIFFQDYDAEPLEEFKAPFTMEDVADTFKVPFLEPQNFLDGDYKYVINAKHMFDGIANDSYQWAGDIKGVPGMEMNVFTLLKQMYGLGKNIEFNITGVVAGICIQNTMMGLRQRYSSSKINVISDAVTHLLIPAIGWSDQDAANLAMKKMCMKFDANYISSAEYLGRK